MKEMKKNGKPGNGVKLSPPQYSYSAMLKAFFAGDSRIKVGECDGERLEIKVADGDCFEALSQCLERHVEFGNLALEIDIVPANKRLLRKPGKCWTTIGAIEEVMKGNPLFVEFTKTYVPVFHKYTVHCVMKPEVVQFANDNIGSPWKLTTYTAEVVARTIFEFCGVQYCSAPIA